MNNLLNLPFDMIQSICNKFDDATMLNFLLCIRSLNNDEAIVTNINVEIYNLSYKFKEPTEYRFYEFKNVYYVIKYKYDYCVSDILITNFDNVYNIILLQYDGDSYLSNRHNRYDRYDSFVESLLRHIKKNKLSLLYDINYKFHSHIKNRYHEFKNVYYYVICDTLENVDLRSVHTIALHNCPITDITALGSIHTVYLIYCYNLTNVSALGSVHTLTIENCPVSDVSALGSVRNLTIKNCPISDVSNLRSVHTLHLSWCNNITTDVSVLHSVHKLTIEECYRVPNIAYLGSIDINYLTP